MDLPSEAEGQIDWASEPDRQALVEAYHALKTHPAAGRIGLEDLAARGSVMAMIYLGSAFKFGEGATKDLGAAEKWYARAAGAGSAFGKYELGRLYLRTHRYEDARRVFIEATERGYVPAIHFLGRIYLFGYGVETDVVKAESYLKTAASRGNLHARRALAHLYLKHGNLRSKLKGIRLWITSAKDIAKAESQGDDGDALR